MAHQQRRLAISPAPPVRLHKATRVVADGPTWESTQLHLPWDVWIHRGPGRKTAQVYNARKVLQEVENGVLSCCVGRQKGYGLHRAKSRVSSAVRPSPSWSFWRRTGSLSAWSNGGGMSMYGRHHQVQPFSRLQHTPTSMPWPSLSASARPRALPLNHSHIQYNSIQSNPHRSTAKRAAGREAEDSAGRRRERDVENRMDSRNENWAGVARGSGRGVRFQGAGEEEGTEEKSYSHKRLVSIGIKLQKIHSRSRVLLKGSKIRRDF